MNSIYIILSYIILLGVVMAVYFQLAGKYKIVDKPNERSSHSIITLRGGGIIFPVSAFIYFTCFNLQYHYFLVGLILISLISFIDDLQELNSYTRLFVQVVAVGLMFFELSLLIIFPFYLLIPLVFLTIAMINAWNFMDGINGITGAYSLLTIFSLIYLNINVVEFSSTGFMIAIVSSLLVFTFYNFRSHARCFAGDVGSITIAYILAILILQLIVITENLNYILFLLLYGLDTASTILFKFIRKEPLLQPHRNYFFQFLANEKGLSHTTVSLIYVSVQLIVNLIVILFIPINCLYFVIFITVSFISFLWLRIHLEGKERLLTKQQILQ